MPALRVDLVVDVRELDEALEVVEHRVAAHSVLEHEGRTADVREDHVVAADRDAPARVARA